MIKSIQFILVFLVILAFGCKKDEDGSSAPEYTIVNNGGAGTTSITDVDDDEPLDVAQAVPSESNEAYPKNIVIMFFLNDKVYLNSLVDNFIVTVNGTIVGGTITVNEASNGYAILIFTPAKEFGAGKEIVVTLKSGIQDDGGNGFVTDFEITFTTTAGSAGSFDDNTGFENGDLGVTFMGDGAILSGTHGSVGPVSGSKFATITSGNALVSSGYAIGGATSMVILGPIDTDVSSLSFDFDFVSSEFNDYVGSIYDDCAVFTICGPNGAYSELIASVNTIGDIGNTQCLNFAGLPDAGDGYAGHTGWQHKTLSLDDIGSPAYIIFTVTDVSDLIFSSALTLDNISY